MRDVAERSSLRAVAMPTEHGGWGLTLEPVLLGLLVAPSIAGVALGLAAMLTFLARTPLKLALVDVYRHRWLPRTRLAVAVALAELLAVAGLVAVAIDRSGWRWLWVVAVASPLIAVELAYEIRSRGRRLAPELCGAVAISGVVAAIVVAAGESERLAAALWLILAARSIAAIPFVRTMVFRLHRGPQPTRPSDTAQVLAVIVAGAAAFTDRGSWLGAAVVAAVAVAHRWWLRRPPVPAKRLGVRQLLLGLALVGLTATGVWIVY